MGAARDARLAAARRRVKRAGGLLREASADLAAARDDDQDVVGVVHVTNYDEGTEAIRLMHLARDRHGAIDVVILARPSPDEQASPTADTIGEGDTHGPHADRREAGRAA